jgi:hypothetical protein
MHDVPPGELIPHALLHESAKMVICASQNGDFMESAGMAEDSLLGLSMAANGSKQVFIHPTMTGPSGVPMQDTYFAGLATMDLFEAFSSTGPIHGTFSRGDFPVRTHGHWNPYGLRKLDRIPGMEPQSSADAASLAPLAMIGQVRCGPESFRTPLIMIDNRMWMTAVIYLVFMCILALTWTLGWRALMKRTRAALNLRSVVPEICGRSCVLTFPPAYRLAVPSARSASLDPMASGSYTSGRMLPLATGSSGTPFRSGGKTNRGDGKAQVGPMDSTNGVATAITTTAAEVKIMYWNIFHDFTLKLTSTEFRSLLSLYDIMFFAETDMLPGEEDPADIPRGYSLVSLPRKPWLQTNRRGGGIALLIRDDIEFVKSHLSSPDILVLDLGSMWLIDAYIPPVTSRWQGWTCNGDMPL